jgi:hypothetical protein
MPSETTNDLNTQRVIDHYKAQVKIDLSRADLRETYGPAFLEILSTHDTSTQAGRAGAGAALVTRFLDDMTLFTSAMVEDVARDAQEGRVSRGRLPVARA